MGYFSMQNPWFGSKLAKHKTELMKPHSEVAWTLFLGSGLKRSIISLAGLGDVLVAGTAGCIACFSWQHGVGGTQEPQSWGLLGWITCKAALLLPTNLRAPCFERGGWCCRDSWSLEQVGHTRWRPLPKIIGHSETEKVGILWQMERSNGINAEACPPTSKWEAWQYAASTWWSFFKATTTTAQDCITASSNTVIAYIEH